MKHAHHLHIIILMPVFFLFVHCPFGSSQNGDGSSGLLALLLGGNDTGTPATPTAANPVFDPAPGTYSATKSITITTGTAGAVIRFTDNGTDPQCPSTGAEYTAPISVPSSITLKAIACKTGMNPSAVVPAVYTIEGTVAAPTFSLASGTYTANQNIALSTTTPSSSIIYTTNGNDPDCTPGGNTYSTPIPVTIPSNVTIKAIGCRAGWTPSTVTSASYSLPSTTPTTTVTPGSGIMIKSTTSIVIKFSETMGTGSLTTGGTLGSSVPVWSRTTFANDTLTLSPATSWTTGAGKTLTVNVSDSEGNPAAAINLSYTVTSGQIYYVKPGGQYPYSGLTPESAMSSISTASLAASSGDVVLVAAGTYYINTSGLTPTMIIIKNGVSIYGGYNSSFQTHDPGANVVTVTDNCISSCGVPVTASSVSSETIFDGFTINSGPAAPYTILISTSSGFTVSRSIINGPYNPTSGGMLPTSTIGVYISSSNARLTENLITGGSGGDGSTGVFVYSGSPILRNNIIKSGTGVSSRMGIQTNSSATIQNNTIYGGSGVGSWVISLAGSGQPVIENNILFADSGSYCFYEMSSADPASFKNNVIRGCSVLYHDADTAQDFSKLCSGNPGNASCTTTLTTPTGSGNLGSDPVFANQAGGDWHLTASSPCTIATGGMDLSAILGQDRDGNIRTAPFSIGAYEWDGGCSP